MTSSQLPGNAFAENADEGSEQQARSSAATSAAAVVQTAMDPKFQAAANGPIPPPPLPAAGRAPNRRESSAERDEIAKRIAAFRNLQISLKREREDYYERTLARTRAALASDAKSAR